jgi:hypothetical protein
LSTFSVRRTKSTAFFLFWCSEIQMLRKVLKTNIVESYY